MDVGVDIERMVRRFRRLTQIRKANIKLAADARRRTQTFVQRTSLDKNSHCFAKGIYSTAERGRRIEGERIRRLEGVF